jgi:hypothetical protein
MTSFAVTALDSRSPFYQQTKTKNAKIDFHEKESVNSSTWAGCDGDRAHAVSRRVMPSCSNTAFSPC